jgi:hypothetical protein
MDIPARMQGLRDELEKLQAKQAEANKVAQQCVISIQQHLGAIAILEELQAERSKNGAMKEKIEA